MALESRQGFGDRPTMAMRRVLARRLRSSSSDGLLNKGDLVDLAEGRDAQKDLLEGGVAEERHSLLPGGLLDLRGRPALQDHLADAVRHVQELRHGRPSEKARLSALLAAHGLVEDLLLIDVGVEARLPE